MKDCTILVNSCDAYSDVWPPFFALLKKYWPDCGPVVLNTESCAFSWPGLEIICPQLYAKGERVPYGKRMKETLKQIRTPFVCCLLDDYFLREPVDEDRLEQLLGWMRADPQLACINFDSSFAGQRSEQYPGFQTLPPVTEYKLNMQAALWRTETLDSLWEETHSPWTWEVLGSRKAFFRSDLKLLYLCPGETSPIQYGKQPGLTWGIVRGKWCENDVVPLFRKEGISVDFARRGFFRPSDAETIQTSSIPFREMLHHLGAGYMLGNLAHVAVDLVRHLFTGSERESYEEYLARKKNPKSGPK